MLAKDITNEDIRKQMILDASSNAEVKLCQNYSLIKQFTNCPQHLMLKCGPCKLTICEVCFNHCHRGHRIELVLKSRGAKCECNTNGKCIRIQQQPKIENIASKEGAIQMSVNKDNAKPQVTTSEAETKLEKLTQHKLNVYNKKYC